MYSLRKNWSLNRRIFAQAECLQPENMRQSLLRLQSHCNYGSGVATSAWFSIFASKLSPVASELQLQCCLQQQPSPAKQRQVLLSGGGTIPYELQMQKLLKEECPHIHKQQQLSSPGNLQKQPDSPGWSSQRPTLPPPCSSAFSCTVLILILGTATCGFTYTVNWLFPSLPSPPKPHISVCSAIH